MSKPDDPLSYHQRKAISVSVAIYRKLVLAYPREFREEYAGEMARYFNEVCEDSVSRGGLVALLVTWMRTLYELAVSARQERARVAPRRDTRPGDAVAVSLFYFPGCGQAYNGQPIKAVAHVLGLIGLPIVSVLWFQADEHIALSIALGIYVYSALEAWLTARRIKVLQRAHY